MSGRVLRAGAAALTLLGAGPALAQQPSPEPPPMRVGAATPSLEGIATDQRLSGTVAARVQSSIAFRLGGKVVSRAVEVGQHVGAGTVLAKLDPAELQADLDNATAALAAARASLQQAKQSFDRQTGLLASGFTTRATYDAARAALDTAQAGVDGAAAALDTAREQRSYADLRAMADGVIVAREVEVGQVVQAGQSVVVLAEDGPRDAVFDIPEVFLTRPPVDLRVDVALERDPSVEVRGTVREVSPILDPATSTVRVRIGLADTPPGMTLGAAVVGRARLERRPALTVPWSALVEADGRPAVWVVSQGRVGLRPVAVSGYLTGSVLVGSGLGASDLVVTSGVQLLYPDQRVEVVPGAAP